MEPLSQNTGTQSKMCPKILQNGSQRRRRRYEKDFLVRQPSESSQEHQHKVGCEAIQEIKDHTPKRGPQNTSKWLPAERELLQKDLFDEVTLRVIPRISVKCLM